MAKVKIVFLVMLAALTLSVCNLPITQGIDEASSAVPMVTVSMITEYRTGPGQAYEVIGVLNPGQEIEALGRSPDGDYLLIRDPASPVSLGWLKHEDVTVSGNPVALPISTPPPMPTVVTAPELAGGCPTPIGGGPTPVSCDGPTGDSISTGGCPTPVGGGPTPVSCDRPIGDSTSASGCPTPVGGGPTPISCDGPTGDSTSASGCPTPIGGGPTPVSCDGPVGGSSSGSGCPTPIGGGPTPVSCDEPGGNSPSGSGCPTPIGGGPTPVSCN
jgi:hypothetical protein